MVENNVCRRFLRFRLTEEVKKKTKDAIYWNKVIRLLLLKRCEWYREIKE